MSNSKQTAETKGPDMDAPFRLDALDGISQLERAKLRVECLKCAIELRAVQKPIGSTIAEAREFEGYVIGSEPTAEPEAAPERQKD